MKSMSLDSAMETNGAVRLDSREAYVSMNKWEDPFAHGMYVA